MQSTSEHFMYMSQAYALAQKAASAGEIPVGAVVVFKGQIIGRGQNQRETLHDPTAHAEILALREAAAWRGDWRLDGASVYVTLEPCPMCAGAIAMARVSLVVFGVHDAAMGCCGSRYDLTGDQSFGKSIKSMGGIMGEQCKELLTTTMQGMRKNK